MYVRKVRYIKHIHTDTDIYTVMDLCMYIDWLTITCMKNQTVSKVEVDQESRQGSKAVLNKEAFPAWCYASEFLPPVPTSIWWVPGPPNQITGPRGSSHSCQYSLKLHPRTALEMRLEIFLSQRRLPICKGQTFQRKLTTITTKVRCFLKKSSEQHILRGKTT